MPKAPRVSVVMPVLNGERYVEEAIHSVLGQTLQDFELIMVDDGCTDRTVAIISRFSHDPRLTLIADGHRGISGALNAGIAAAKGDLIARFDADDVMLPNRLERQVDFLSRHPALGGAASNYDVIDENGTLCGSHRSQLTSVAKLEEFLASGSHLVFPHPAMIFKRALWQELGGYKDSYAGCEDVEFFLRMVDSGHPIIYQPETLIRFRNHSTSVSALSTRKQTHLNTLIFENRARRLAGQAELTPEQYFERYERAGWLVRTRMEARIQSALFMRRRAMAQTRQQKTRALIYTAAAVLLSPERALNKARREIKGALRSESPLASQAPRP